MAVEQSSKSKVGPVLDYRELNSHVPSHTADADVCADTLRKWRRHEENIAFVDLKRAYLQLRTDQRLWSFQTVVIGGRRYALTRIGFGLDMGRGPDGHESGGARSTATRPRRGACDDPVCR